MPLMGYSAIVFSEPIGVLVVSGQGDERLALVRRRRLESNSDVNWLNFAGCEGFHSSPCRDLKRKTWANRR